jgi:hypothetical protein
MNDKEPTKEASKRSPNYPGISLETSVDNVKTVYERDKLAATSADVIVGHLGYNRLHGTSRRSLSSMKQYGLLDELSDNRYKVSETAFRLINSDLNSPKAIEMLKDAALKPPIFRNILEEYKGELPSNQTLTSYLVLDKGFTPDGAQIFIKVLRDNVEFANITKDDFVENFDESKSFPQESNMMGQLQQQNNLSQPPLAANINQAQQAFNLPTPETKETVLNFKISRKSEARIIFYGEEVTQEAIEALRAILETQKVVYPTKQELEEEKKQPKTATWKNKDFDLPVKVVGELGEKDGKKFYAVEGTNTGISQDELDFENEDQ